MYSDTHFHFKILKEDEEWTRKSVLQKMSQNSCAFALDIGTDCDDLASRQELFEATFAQMQGDGPDAKACADSCKKFVYFTAGIWPDPDSIKNRASCVETLKKNILAFPLTLFSFALFFSSIYSVTPSTLSLALVACVQFI